MVKVEPRTHQVLENEDKIMAFRHQDEFIIEEAFVNNRLELKLKRSAI